MRASVVGLLVVLMCQVHAVVGDRSKVDSFILDFTDLMWNQHDVKGSGAFLEDTYYHNSPLNAIDYALAGVKLTGRGRYPFLTTVEEWLAAFPDTHMDVTDMIVSDRDFNQVQRRRGDMYTGAEYEVFYKWVMTGTHEGCGWMGEPTSQEVKFRGMTLAHVSHSESEGFKIREEWTYSDAFDMLKQLRIIKHQEGTSERTRRVLTSRSLLKAIKDHEEDQDQLRKVIQLVRSSYDYLWNYKEIDDATVSRYLADDLQWYDNLHVFAGLAEFQKYARHRFSVFPDGAYYVDSAMGALLQGEEKDVYRVAVHYTFHGTNSGDGFLDLKATGRKVVTGGIALFTVKNGKITEVEDLHDVHNALAQMEHIEKETNTCGARKRSERDRAIDRKAKEEYKRRGN